MMHLLWLSLLGLTGLAPCVVAQSAMPRVKEGKWKPVRVQGRRLLGVEGATGGRGTEADSPASERRQGRQPRLEGTARPA